MRYFSAGFLVMLCFAWHGHSPEWAIFMSASLIVIAMPKSVK